MNSNSNYLSIVNVEVALGKIHKSGSKSNKTKRWHEEMSIPKGLLTLFEQCILCTNLKISWFDTIPVQVLSHTSTWKTRSEKQVNQECAERSAATCTPIVNITEKKSNLTETS